MRLIPGRNTNWFGLFYFCKYVKWNSFCHYEWKFEIQKVEHKDVCTWGEVHVCPCVYVLLLIYFSSPCTHTGGLWLNIWCTFSYILKIWTSNNIPGLTHFFSSCALPPPFLKKSSTSGTIDRWFNVPSAIMFIPMLPLRASVLFNRVFSLCLSLRIVYQLIFWVLDKIFYYKYVVYNLVFS